MKITKLLCLSSLLLTGIAQAAPMCENFEIKITNALADDLFVHSIRLEGATITPTSFQEVKKNGGAILFKVNNSIEGIPMVGHMELKTESIPIKKVNIQFQLNNTTIYCEHTDDNSGGDYQVIKSRHNNQVEYTIK